MDPHLQKCCLLADFTKRSCVDIVKICSQMVQLTRFGAHVLDFIDIKAVDMHIHFFISPSEKPYDPNPTLSSVCESRAV